MIDKATKAEILKQWGHESQLMQGMEECCELSVALSHLRRKTTRENIAAVIEEIADVELMIEQFKYMYNIPDATINDKIREKLERVKGLLKTPAPAQAQTVTPESGI